MRLRVLATVFVASSITFVAAQTPPAGSKPQEQRPTFRTEANFVRVDVYPTSGGRAVTDLKLEDFEVLEDGVPQRIETFEHVTVRPAGAQATRIEPNTIGESLDMARNPRARVIILFLDVPHVTMQGSWTIREPLIRLLDQILGPDDLVGVMTPAMAPSDVVLARKTEVIAGGLRDVWPWGERFTLALNEQEKLYEFCYVSVAPDVVAEMTARRRERATLEALDELVRHLRDLREERKAIVTVTEGWLLYRANPDLVRLRTLPDGRTEPIPGVDPITVGPDGKLTTKNTRDSSGGFRKSECDGDRMRLAYIDDFQFMRDLMDDANRANATFYTVDPRGLPVFDSPIGPAAPPPPHIDADILRTRQDSMRMLAHNTDGLPVLNSNDLDRGLRRIADDLTSYYLLGYYSTNAKPDGKFHGIKVRVKRPGVDVRARRGYRAATAEEVAAARSAPAAPVRESVASVTTAIDALSRLRPEARLHVNALAWSGGTAPAVWVAGELPSRPGDADWTQGGVADVEVKQGSATGTGRVTLAPGQRTFLTKIPLNAASSGAVEVRVRATPSAAPAERASEMLTTDFSPGLPRPLLFRRGPSTANRQQPVAGFLFSRSDRAHLEIPLPAGTTAGAARLLGRNGEPLAIPVTVGERTDAEDGQRWLTADLTLAPLAPADYVIEITARKGNDEQRVVTAIRVGR